MLLKIFTSPFLTVQNSFWPILLRLALFSSLFSLVLYLHIKLSPFLFFFNIGLVALISFLWWKDVLRESLLGYHTHKLEVSLRSAILLFILSEVFFFVSFFWAFFDSSLSPTLEVGLSWPPKGITPLSVYSVPLLNTLVLLSRGVTVTWAHHSLINNFFTKTFWRLLFTVIFGVYFIFLQWDEYCITAHSMSDGIYGSTFFLTTGFHGIHVCIGTCFLLYVLISLAESKLLFNHHFSFEAAAWYWHFVDVVWLFLYISIYWWGC